MDLWLIQDVVELLTSQVVQLEMKEDVKIQGFKHTKTWACLKNANLVQALHSRQQPFSTGWPRKDSKHVPNSGLAPMISTVYRVYCWEMAMAQSQGCNGGHRFDVYSSSSQPFCGSMSGAGLTHALRFWMIRNASKYQSCLCFSRSSLGSVRWLSSTQTRWLTEWCCSALFLWGKGKTTYLIIFVWFFSLVCFAFMIISFYMFDNWNSVFDPSQTSSNLTTGGHEVQHNVAVGDACAFGNLAWSVWGLSWISGVVFSSALKR